MVTRKQPPVRHPVWEAISDAIVKTIPTLMVACVIAVTGGALATYQGVDKLTNKVSQHEKEIEMLKIRLINVEQNYMKSDDLLALLKRVEQQLEIAMLRAGVKVQPKMLSSDRK